MECPYGPYDYFLQDRYPSDSILGAAAVLAYRMERRLPAKENDGAKGVRKALDHPHDNTQALPTLGSHRELCLGVRGWGESE